MNKITKILLELAKEHTYQEKVKITYVEEAKRLIYEEINDKLNNMKKELAYCCSGGDFHVPRCEGTCGLLEVDGYIHNEAIDQISQTLKTLLL